MALRDLKGLTIEIGGDTSNLTTALKDVNGEITNLQSNLRTINSALKLDPGNVEAVAQKQKLLSEAVEQTSQKLETLKEAQRQADEQMANGVDVDEQAYRSLQSEIIRTEASLNDYTRQLDGMERASEKASDSTDDFSENMDDASENADDLAENVEDAGRAAEEADDGFTVWKATLADLAADVIRSLIDSCKELAKQVVDIGMNFEAQMSKVQAISNATAEDMDKLEAKARELGASTKFSATEVAEGFEYMAMAGWKTSDMLDGIEGLLNLAAASGEDLGRASDIVTDALTAMGYSSGEAGRMADVMAAASSNANTNVSMMGETFKYAAPIAGALGYEIEDLALVTGLMANSGIKGEMAGTALRGSLTNLISPAKTASDAMEGLGFYTEEVVDVFDQQKIDEQMLKVEKATLSVDKAQTALNTAVSKYGKDSDQATQAAASLAIKKEELRMASEKLTVLQEGEAKTIYGVNEAILNQDGSMKSLRETLVFLREKFANLSEAEQAAAAASIFGQEAMSGMLSVINASDEDFNKLTGAIDDSEGAAAKMAATMQDNLQGDVTTMNSALEELALKMYDQVQPALRSIVQFITGNVVPALTWIIQNLPIIGTAIAAIIATIVAYKWASIITFITNVGTAISGLFAMLVANPIGLVVAAVGALAVGIVALISAANESGKAIKENAKNVTAFGEAIASATPNIGDMSMMISEYGRSLFELDAAISETENAITTILSTALSEQRQLRDDEIASIKEHNEKLKALQEEKLNMYREAMTVEIMKITSEAQTMSQEQAAQYMANIQAALDQANAVSEERYNAQLAQIYNYHKTQGTLNSEAYQNDIEMARVAYNQELADSQAFYNQGLSQLQTHANQWVSTDAEKWNKVIENTNGSKRAYKDALAEIDLDNANAFMSMYTTTVQKGGEISAETAEIATSMLEAFDDLPKGMEEAGKDALLGIVSGLEDEIPALENASEMTAQEIVDTLKSELQINSPSRVTRGIGENVSTGLQSGMDGKKSTVNRSATGIAETILTGLKSKDREMNGVGANMVEGVEAGMQSKKSWIGGKVSSFASSLVSNFKKAFDINSPSRIMRDQIGAMLAEGVGVGIEENAESALDPMETLKDELTAFDGLSVSKSINVSGSSQTGVQKLSAEINDLKSLIGQYLPEIAGNAKKNIYLDKNRLVGELASDMDTALGEIAERRAVGAV